MATKIFVNLAVKDLNASKAFFEKLGFTFNPQFTNEEAGCMVISENSFVMLLTHDKFRQFTTKQIADAKQTCQVMVAFSSQSRDEVDKLLNQALQLGGNETREPQDYGFMYGRAFEDLDGNIWEAIWMDNGAVPE